MINVNRLLIANRSALCQYFPIEILSISNLRKYFELGLITPKKQNIGYWVSRSLKHKEIVNRTLEKFSKSVICVNRKRIQKRKFDLQERKKIHKIENIFEYQIRLRKSSLCLIKTYQVQTVANHKLLVHQFWEVIALRVILLINHSK